MKRIIFSFVVATAIAVSAVVVTSCGNIQAQGGGNAQSVQWEYKMVGYNDYGSDMQEAIPMLNGLGAEGWELVSVARRQNADVQFTLNGTYFYISQSISEKSQKNAIE